MIVSFCSKALG